MTQRWFAAKGRHERGTPEPCGRVLVEPGRLLHLLRSRRWRGGRAPATCPIPTRLTEVQMPKFLWQVSYTAQGAQGLRKDGGSARRAVVQRLVEQAGGKVEAMYFALGEADAYVIADLPDTRTAMAISATVNAAGGAHLRTVLLLTPEEMDAAVKQTVDYRAPGAGGQ
jgi:uncharacterized protein with GYD domain